MRIINQSVLTLASAALFCGVALGQDASSAHSSSETQLKSGDVRATHLIGAMVKRLTGDSVGEVKDLIVSADKDVRLAVISVGGVLGVGSKTIALPFNQFQVAPDGATLFLTLSEEELSARPAFDLENVTADSPSTDNDFAAPAQQTLPDASSPGFVPSNTTHESFAQDTGQPAEAESAQPSFGSAQPSSFEAAQPSFEAAESSQPSAFESQPAAPEIVVPAEQVQVTADAQVVEEAQLAERQAHEAEQAELAEQAQPEQQAQEAELARQAEQAHEAALAQLSEQAQLDQQARQAQAASKAKASNQAASALIGKDVVDPQNTAIGKVNDVVVTAEPPQVQVIVQLSEELGSGAKLVAVPLPELTISQGGSEDARQIDRVETELTVAQLEALPQFQY
ncbi:MAG TPA: PRC-barrel domain-containing protein [Gammaproteobacteria bacterium]|nr:PRC-barrel domain-containing protein [Gammaproteobacteria bacterium]